MRTRHIGGVPTGFIGLGAMPLSIEGRPDESRAIATIHAAPDPVHAAFHAIARERGVSPQQVCLAWLLAWSPVVIPIPGASRPEKIRDFAAAIDLSFSADAVLLAVGAAPGTVQLWDLRNPASRPVGRITMKDRSLALNGLAFSPVGRMFAFILSNGTAELWTAAEPARAARTAAFQAHGGWSSAVTFSPDGKTLATGGWDDKARVWNVTDPANPRLLGTISVHGVDSKVTAVAFLPDGHLLTASHEATMRLWDVVDAADVRRAGSFGGPEHLLGAVALAPDGRLLATDTLGADVQLWRLGATPRRAATLRGHTAFVCAFAFGPGGRLLASGSYDTTARLWEVSDPYHPRALGESRGHGGYVNSVAFVPGGRLLATGSEDRTIRLWNVSDPARPRPLAVLTGHTDLVAGAAFSPDGRFLATTSADHTVKVWDLTGEAPGLHATLTGHTDWALGVAFRPDGGVLATGSQDGTVRLWSVDPGWTARRLCRQVGTAITREEWAQYLPDVPYDPPCP